MRGQAHTLEGTVAALLMLSSLIFALQITAVTPLSASTSSQHIENQQQSTAQGVLAAAENADALKPAILFYDDGNGEYRNYESSDNSRGTPDNRFGIMLENSFGDRYIAYNVNFYAESPDSPQQYINNGVPSDNAVSARHTVTVNNDDRFFERNSDWAAKEWKAQPTSNQVGDSSSFWLSLSNSPPESKTVVVEVVVWRL